MKSTTPSSAAERVPLTAAPASTAASGEHDSSLHLREIASFAHQVTGVAVAHDGRIFVNFPRWTEDAPISVGVLTAEGDVRPYPDDRWNSWRNAKRDQLSPHDRWVCVQAMFCDSQNNLWVLDPGAPAQAFVVPGAPKLVRIDLATDSVAQCIAFAPDIARQGSYLNDVRISPDGTTAYITDSGTQGALVVIDLGSGQMRRVLDGHPSTQMDASVTVHANGAPLRRPDGRGVEFSADGIALTRDGQYLFWQAVKGKTLYRVPTDALRDPALSCDEVGRRVDKVLEHGPADGLHFDRAGRLLISAVEEHAVKVWDGESLVTLLHEPGLRWPDTFAEGPDGSIYLTDSRIPEMSWFKPGNPAALPSRLLMIAGGEPAGVAGG
ncbi:major royal jelly family protein [Paraburkholderia sp. MMS20-SJTR3]|uniref:Major royal jelly family protein n=1 Tax=Paraburkholderia sejongensis TaxID=2886946 RepID=A0ABS8K1G9_9BURK|nr:major royal jelly family protein [Paraburkholderia sp. MMS20-SJTR3]MCC8396006.1 major royal jelly family protein [Paraburkholderia sp. MMS20-SJTR3]